jgi:hypothetical protein
MTAQRKLAGEYELIDHGIEHAQYFQGCGTAFTSFDNVVTGCGSNAAEAIDDALEALAQCDVDAEELNARMLKDENRKSWPKRPAVTSKHSDEHYYYVSIRWNEAE